MVLITFSLRGNRLNLLQMKMARLVGLVIEVGQVNGSRRGRISKLEDSRHLEVNTAHSVRREYWPCLLGMRIEERRMECFTPLLLPPPPLPYRRANISQPCPIATSTGDATRGWQKGVLAGQRHCINVACS